MNSIGLTLIAPVTYSGELYRESRRFLRVAIASANPVTSFKIYFEAFLKDLGPSAPRSPKIAC
jgi:hypothetical protein